MLKRLLVKIYITAFFLVLLYPALQKDGWAQNNDPQADNIIDNIRSNLSSGISKSEKALIEINKALEYDPENKNALNLKAILLSQHNQLAEAENIFRQLSTDSKNWLYHYNLAYNIVLQGKIAAAIPQLTTAASLSPKNPLIYSLRAICYLLLGDTKNKEADYRRMLEINPKNHNILVQMASDYYFAKDYDKSAKYINEALNVMRLPYYLFLKGMILTAQKKYTQAIDSLNLAVSYNPYAGLPYLGRGYSQMSVNNFGAAIDDFNQAINQGLVVRGNVLKGIALYQQKKFPESKAALDKAIVMDTKNPKAYLYYGKILYLENNKQQAKRYFDRAVDINPQDEQFYNDYGWFLAANKEYEEALLQFDVAINLNKNHPIYWWGRGTANYGLKRYRQALFDLNSSIELDSTFGPAYHKRADIQLKLGDVKSALLDANTACKLGETDACP